MNVNIFALEFCQPLVWVALALVALIGIPNVLFYREFSFGYYPKEVRILKIYNWILVVAVAVLWAVVVIVNHTTVLWDLINFAFLLGFSIVFALIAAIAFVVAVSIIVVCVLELYYLFLALKFLFTKE